MHAFTRLLLLLLFPDDLYSLNAHFCEGDIHLLLIREDKSDAPHHGTIVPS